MGLIDSDPLWDEVRELADYAKKHKLLGVYDGLFMAISAIDRAPDIEAEPVRHAKLLITEAYPHRVYCGDCYRTLIPNEEYCFEIGLYPSYCMWCGAKLDDVEVLDEEGIE